MRKVKTGVKNYRQYSEFLNHDAEIEMEYYIKKNKGKKIAMINATSFGGGVAEILHSLVPLACSAGLVIDWWNMEGIDEFYKATKMMHNCLQGMEHELTAKEKEIYLKYNNKNAEDFADEEYDYIIVHDPQPAAMIDYIPKSRKAKWIWRCHIDTSAPNEEYWSFLSGFIKKYEACVFTMEEFIYEKAVLSNVAIITPSIDPLSKKNIPLAEEEAKEIISRFGIDVNRPLISQVSRFDPWKDPLGVIEAYKIVKKEYPSVQLALIGSMASDDPEGWEYLYRTLRRAGEDYDIEVITNFNGVSDLEVNAFQTASDVILQKSIKEGFGLTVAEGMWKGVPVIGGRAGGIKLQIDDGINGYLADTVEECAVRILTLLRNMALAVEIGEAGREKVRAKFLITSHLLNYLKLFEQLED